MEAIENAAKVTADAADKKEKGILRRVLPTLIGLIIFTTLFSLAIRYIDIRFF